MSPLKLGLCLHYHSSPVDSPLLDLSAPIRDETMDDLVRDGLLCDAGAGFVPYLKKSRYSPTEKLHAFVAMLESTPLPIRRFLDPRTITVINGPGVPTDNSSETG